MTDWSPFSPTLLLTAAAMSAFLTPRAAAAPLARRALVAGAPRPVASAAPQVARRGTRRAAPIRAFPFLKDLGFKKPAFLPDFGCDQRAALIEDYFGVGKRGLNRARSERLLAPDFAFLEATGRRYDKRAFINIVNNVVGEAAPDFSWTAATDGAVDADGYAIVEVEPTGHHTGQPLALPGHPEIPPSGTRFHLPRALFKVKVEGGRRVQLRPWPASRSRKRPRNQPINH
jgi:hypothetical protein